MPISAVAAKAGRSTNDTRNGFPWDQRRLMLCGRPPPEARRPTLRGWNPPTSARNKEPDMQQRAHRQARSTRMRVVLAICAVLGFPVLAAADDYPSRPIRLLVGFTAGGPTDVPARFLADRLSGSLGKP